MLARFKMSQRHGPVVWSAALASLAIVFDVSRDSASPLARPAAADSVMAERPVFPSTPT